MEPNYCTGKKWEYKDVLTIFIDHYSLYILFYAVLYIFHKRPIYKSAKPMPQCPPQEFMHI